MKTRRVIVITYEVRPPAVLSRKHRELVRRLPIVRPHIARIYQPRAIARDTATGPG